MNTLLWEQKHGHDIWRTGYTTKEGIDLVSEIVPEQNKQFAVSVRRIEADGAFVTVKDNAFFTLRDAQRYAVRIMRLIAQHHNVFDRCNTTPADYGE